MFSKLFMCFNCRGIAYVSRESGELIAEYHNFQKYCMQTSQLLILIQTSRVPRNTQVFELYTQALEAHTTAINSFIQIVALYETLFQKYSNSYYSLYTSATNSATQASFSDEY